jgi:hypothetical protein
MGEVILQVTHSKMDPRVTGMLPEAAAEDFSGLV